MGGDSERARRVDRKFLRFWGLIFLAFWGLSTISNLSGPFDATGIVPSLFLGFGEAVVLLAVSLWVARRRAWRR